MSPLASRLRASAQVMGGALAAELVVYLGVLFASSTAAGQPAQQINCCCYDMAGPALPGCDEPRVQRIALGLNGLPFSRTTQRSAGVFAIS